MAFKKGHKGYWSGKKQSKESNIKKSISLKKAYLEGRKLLGKNNFHKGHKINLGRLHSEEHKDKIREKAIIGNYANNLLEYYKNNKPWNKGKTGLTISEETIKKIVNSRRGYKHSQETKLKISKANLGKKNTLGKHHTEETKIKIGKANSGINSGLFGKEPWNKGIKVKEEERLRLKQLRKYQIFPKKDTSIEIKIQKLLKELSITFLTHQYMKDIEHGYQCDILIPSLNMVIECDGDYWHKYPIGKDIDKVRTSELVEKGFKVLRLWEHEIKVMDINKFKELIK